MKTETGFACDLKQMSPAPRIRTKPLSRKRRIKIKRQRARAWLKNICKSSAENHILTIEHYTDEATQLPMERKVWENKLTKKQTIILDIR